MPVVERWAYQCNPIRLKSIATRVASDQSGMLVKEGVGAARQRPILCQRLRLSSPHSSATSKRDVLGGERSGNTDRSTSLPLMAQGCFCGGYCKKRNMRAHGNRKASKQEWVRRKQ